MFSQKSKVFTQIHSIPVSPYLNLQSRHTGKRAVNYQDDSPSDEDIFHPAKKAKGGTTPGRSRFGVNTIDVSRILCYHACLVFIARLSTADSE